MKYFLNKCGNFNMGDGILWMKTKAWMTENLPEFYREILGAWGNFLKQVEYSPHGRENILNQPLFLNNNILSQGKVLYYKKWIEVGILKVRDILYEFKEGFLTEQYVIDTMEEAKEEYNRKEIEKNLDIIKQAIPKEWIRSIENFEKEKETKEVYVKTGEKICNFNECTVKNIYCFFRENVFKEPTANKYWIEKYKNVKANEIWGNMKGRYVETKVECLEFLIRHKAIFSDVILNKIGMEQSGMCKVCQKEEEGFLHMFLYCQELEGFLKDCKVLIKGLLGDWDENETEWNRVVMLGWNKNNENKKIVNLCIMLMKNAMWERRIVAKKEKMVMDVWGIFKRKMERYVEKLYVYHKNENILSELHKILTDKACQVFKEMNWKLPHF